MRGGGAEVRSKEGRLVPQTWRKFSTGGRRFSGDAARKAKLCPSARTDLPQRKETGPVSFLSFFFLPGLFVFSSSEFASD